jgi:hypothetical protein
MSNKLPIALCPIYGLNIPSKSNQKSDNAYQLSNDVKIRPVGKDDIKLLEGSLSFLLEAAFSQLVGKTFVVEFLAKDHNQCEKVVNNTILALRLHKSGEVHPGLIWDNSGIVIHSEPRIALSEIYTLGMSPSSYGLAPSEFDEVKHLYEKMVALDILTKPKPALGIACERFNRASVDRKDDDKIIDFAVAFESLFLGGNKSSNIPAGQFIGLGCSMLIGKNSEERRAINEFLISAFTVRNSVVHGAASSAFKINGKTVDLSQVAIQMETYLRTSLVKIIME